MHGLCAGLCASIAFARRAHHHLLAIVTLIAAGIHELIEATGHAARQANAAGALALWAWRALAAKQRATTAFASHRSHSWLAAGERRFRYSLNSFGVTPSTSASRHTISQEGVLESPSRA